MLRSQHKNANSEIQQWLKQQLQTQATLKTGRGSTLENHPKIKHEKKGSRIQRLKNNAKQ